VPLYPYQAEGALFAVRTGRALIADDMGLGKTVQAIAAMEILARHFGLSRTLVVCPASLKYQRQSEIARFSGRAARVMTGGRGQRRNDFAEEDFCKITNYEKLQPDLDLIADCAPELVIVDEAQRIKNWNTVAARALKRIDSPYALVLTGTPLVNMDLPWNPALLEQRIARIHRMGQTRPVQVVNFVAKGTIEEGMQSVLSFKRSLSAGILDGGLGEIALGGSRLSRFMKEVEGVTGRVAESDAMAPAEEAGSEAALGPEAASDASAAHLPADDIDTATHEDAEEPRQTSSDPWAALLQVGSQLVSALVSPDRASGTPLPWIERDPATGAHNLKIPLPPPDVARRLADALSGIAGMLRGGSSARE
jgi:hypothetical protein